MEKFNFFVTTMSDQEPDPDPHWFGTVNSDLYPYGNQVRIHNTEAWCFKEIELSRLS
jgi:hypothetical protein